MATPTTCAYCGPTDRELRPYGPGGSFVCLPCVQESPEREDAAHNAFGALLDAATAISPSGIVAIGETDGPRPFDPRAVSGSCETPGATEEQKR